MSERSAAARLDPNNWIDRNNGGRIWAGDRLGGDVWLAISPPPCRRWYAVLCGRCRRVGHRAGEHMPSLTFARSNAEFIDEMIADPVFADMLADPGPEAEQSEDAAPDSHSHSLDHAGGSSHSHSQPHTHTHSQSHSHSHSLPQPHAHSHSHPNPQAQPHSHTPTPTSSSSPRPKPSQGENDLAQDKVRSTLRSFVRDWSVEGASERKACYDPCLEALERHFPVVPGGRHRGEVKVLVPGCGLGRLAMEIAARGESQWSKREGVAVRRS